MRSAGLDVRPWIYRAYPDKNDSFILEIKRFAAEDDLFPFEDVSSSFFILNTNYNNSCRDHDDMISQQKAAAYFAPWKYSIDRLSKDDTVFLYQSGSGIVAMGKADGRLETADYHGDSGYENEEHFMSLENFRHIEPPLSAAEIKEITETNHVFRKTLFSIDKESGENLSKYINNLSQ